MNKLRRIDSDSVKSCDLVAVYTQADAKNTVLNAGTRTDARKPSMCVQHFIVINTYNELLSAQKRGSPHGARRAHGHIISVRTESLAGPGQLPPILLILNDPPNCPFSS